MNIIDPLIAELKHEAIATRKALERVPDDKLDWRPHDKSMTMGRLAGHVAELPQWVLMTLEHDEFAIDENYEPFDPESNSELVEGFDANLENALLVMKGQENEHLTANWKLKSAGNVLFEMPRVAVLRSMVLNHLVHHRGQLTVYLRFNDIAVPSVYGPSADEQ